MVSIISWLKRKLRALRAPKPPADRPPKETDEDGGMSGW